MKYCITYKHKKIIGRDVAKAIVD